MTSKVWQPVAELVDVHAPIPVRIQCFQEPVELRLRQPKTKPTDAFLQLSHVDVAGACGRARFRAGKSSDQANKKDVRTITIDGAEDIFSRANYAAVQLSLKGYTAPKRSAHCLLLSLVPLSCRQLHHLRRASEWARAKGQGKGSVLCSLLTPCIAPASYASAGGAFFSSCGLRSATCFWTCNARSVAMVVLMRPATSLSLRE